MFTSIAIIVIGTELAALALVLLRNYRRQHPNRYHKTPIAGDVFGVIGTGFAVILAFVIFAVATDPRVPRSVPPFAIGATVAAGALVTGPLTGGSFNPARTLGPAAAGGGFAAHWLYWLAPMLGMVAGARAYERLRLDDSPARNVKAVLLGAEGPI